MRKSALIAVVFAEIIFCSLILTSCKKEVVPGSTQFKFTMTGTFGDEQIKIGGRIAPFTEINCKPEANDNNHQYRSSNDDGNGDENDDEDESDGDEDEDEVTLITGANFTNLDYTANITGGSIELKKIILRIYVAPILAQTHYDMLTPDSYPLVNSQTNSQGALIRILDQNGVLWTSKGNQGSNYFTITSRGAIQQNTAEFSGAFSAKMYNGSGGKKTLTVTSFNAVAGL